MDAVSAGNIEGMSRGELSKPDLIAFEIVGERCAKAGLCSAASVEEINKVETDIRKRLPIGWSTSYASLVREYVARVHS